FVVITNGLVNPNTDGLSNPEILWRVPTPDPVILEVRMKSLREHLVLARVAYETRIEGWEETRDERDEVFSEATSTQESDGKGTRDKHCLVVDYTPVQVFAAFEPSGSAQIGSA